MGFVFKEVEMNVKQSLCRSLMAACLLIGGSLAHALPIQLKDGNGTQYNVNTQVSPLITDSLASGALTDATYTKPVTVTSYYYFITFFGGISTASVQYDVNVPLTNAFNGFNGLLFTSINGTPLMQPLVYNPAQALAGMDCPSNGKEQQLIFPTQTFPAVNLSVTRKMFVSRNKDYARWLNIVTNTGTEPMQVGITLRGLIASANQTKITATSNGGTLNAASNWFTSSQVVPQNEKSFEPKIGFVVQNTAGASAPASSVGINSFGQAAFTYSPTIQPGQTVIVMTFVTVQGKTKNAKSTCENIVANPLPSDTITCMSELELSQVVNFPKVTPPVIKSSTVQLKFNKTGQDTVQWKGSITIGAGISLQNLPVIVNFGGVPTSFILKKNGSANAGGGNKFNLQAKLSGGVTKAGTVKVSFNLKGDYQAALAAYGLTNESASNATVTIPLTVSVGTSGAGAGGNRAYTWNATAGKSGKAKAP
jgi:hypothetical protein